MGRGRKGVLVQSNTTKASGGLRGRRGDPTGYFLSEPIIGEEKILIKEDALEFMKNMNQQELVDFLLSDDDWHVKTSGINASGC